ncbi:MAG TPA: lysylphosphatidylglycerol synthase transmembrane domain-containing protein [Candidatus Acidoferrales bacterium]|nr:lysylphosphatidylglycerol synthase transmembrane domain-containing protein [Candidatus Acidoferrales bacterium]
MRQSVRKTFWLILGLAIVAALLYRSRSAVMLSGFNWQKLGTALENASLPLLLLGLVSIYVSYALRSLRWVRFSRYMGRPTFRNVYSATIMGFTAVFVLGRAGEPVRPLLIARKDGLPVADSFGVYVLERVFDVGATAVLAILALLALPRQSLAGAEANSGGLVHDARLAGWVLFWSLIGLIAVLVYFRFHGARALQSRLGGFRARGGWRGKIATLIDGFSEGLQAIRSPGDLFAAVAYTVVHWLVVALVYLLVMRGFSGQMGEFGFRAALLVLAFTMVGSVMQLPAVGGGTQVATFLVLTVIFGVEKEPAAAVAIVLWLVTFAGACIAGIPLLIREGWSMGDLRRMAREEATREEHGGHASIGDTAKHRREQP